MTLYLIALFLTITTTTFCIMNELYKKEEM